MHVRLLLCGVLGGILATFALTQPLYLVLPTYYSGEWHSWVRIAWPSFGAFGFVLTLGVGLGTGYCSARWGWSSSLAGRIKDGALAGLLASLIAFALVGAAAAGVAGNGPVYEHGARPAASPSDAVYVVCETVVRLGWYPYLTFCAMVAGGSILGGFGGWICDRGGAPNWGNAPPSIAAVPFDAAFTIMILTTLILVVSLHSLDNVAEKVDESRSRYGFQLSLPPGGIVDWPVFISLIVLAASSWLCGRWCALHWEHSMRGVRATAKLAIRVLEALPVLTLLAIVVLRPQMYRDPFILLGAGAWVIAVLLCVGRILRRTDAQLAELPIPSFRDRLLINACLLGVVLPPLVIVAGLSQATAMALGIVTYIDVLFGRGASANPSAAASIHQIFVYHFQFSFYIAAAWMLFAAIHASLISWLLDRKVSGTNH